MRKIYKQGDRAALLVAVRRGEPVPSAARRLGVTMPTAYRWIRESPDDELEKPTTFIELVPPREVDGRVTVKVGLAEIEVRPGFDPALLRAVVATLGGDS